MGSQEPSERVAPDYTASDGLDAAKLVRIGGTVLDPWQSDILDDWLGRTPAGKWAAPSAGGSVPRQNGKSLLIQARSEAGMLLYNEQVVYTAHLQKTATETFEEMRDFFEGPKLRRHVAEIKTAIGREQIILKSGARIKFLARTRNGGRGQPEPADALSGHAARRERRRHGFPPHPRRCAGRQRQAHGMV